jgi:dihydrofolate synthase/folylpolyglutamate synthase
MEYSEIKAFLNDTPQYGETTGVERAGKLLELLGNPDKNLKIIHIAGTNGKGSVCSYIDDILKKSGYKTGLFTSPHLVTIRERIQIDGELISREAFTQYFNKVYETARANNLKLAYFDFFFGAAMLYFDKCKVDYVVLETGLGGSLDATNAVHNPLCCVITTISLEHTAILGDTIKKIAEQKAGIIKQGVPVVYADDNEASSVIEDIAYSKNSYCYGVSPQQYQIIKNFNGCIDFSLHNEYYINNCLRLATPAIYQVENVSIAITVCRLLKHLYHSDIKDSAIVDSTGSHIWQGRMEKLTDNIYVDGAHNPQGIQSFVNSVNGMYADSTDKAALLFSVVSDKNFEQMISILCGCKVFARIAITVTGGIRHLDKEYISAAFKRHTDIEVEVYDSAKEAVLALKNEPMVFCTGSLYLVADIRKVLE